MPKVQVRTSLSVNFRMRAAVHNIRTGKPLSAFAWCRKGWLAFAEYAAMPGGAVGWSVQMIARCNLKVAWVLLNMACALLLRQPLLLLMCWE
jgi:hypothetical protein